MEEMYGPGIDTETRRALGAYGSRNGVFTLAAENMRSTSDTRESIRHEVLGHYGLDTFAPDYLRRTKGFYLSNGLNSIPRDGSPRPALLHQLQQRVQGRGLAALVAKNASSAKDARETFRHEILGHFGLNTFTPKDKEALLKSIRSTRDVESIKPYWAKIDSRYHVTLEV